MKIFGLLLFIFFISSVHGRSLGKSDDPVKHYCGMVLIYEFKKACPYGFAKDSPHKKCCSDGCTKEYIRSSLSNNGPLTEMKAAHLLFALLVVLVAAMAVEGRFFQAKADDFADFDKDPYPTHTNCYQKKVFIFSVLTCYA
ncbi:hypothetical protein QR680_008367 [Steinernema hermaphroditum]|uniref:Uncharacterized protein n=1 Tax=Steinernema hermaphroditum TaxID=289476 RepID=A0AA39IGC4_9BILA|nr:hypothetical protein QR680_008367 [Steinernema hermaphroditum]